VEQSAKRKSLRLQDKDDGEPDNGAKLNKQTSVRGALRKGIRDLRENPMSLSFLHGRLPSPADAWAAGKELRKEIPRESHAGWQPGNRRPDPVEILIASNKGRIPELVPIRHGRMLSSSFAFLRGSAAVMAADLATTPVTGLHVQACGDCHLMNFGGFATPERNIFFDINDFDETLAAPWEWDVKRLAASFVCAGRYIGLKNSESAKAARNAVKFYRTAMAEYSRMPAFKVWYEHMNLQELIERFVEPENRGQIRGRIAKMRQRTVAEHDFPKMVQAEAGVFRITDNPPLIYHGPRQQRADFEAVAIDAIKRYRDTLAEHHRLLFDRFKPVDFAVKVVGVGSVGTLCGIGLFMASDSDPLFLQIKQANASVLEPYAGGTKFPNHGQRVVMGQRMMQTASDIMLGWTLGSKGEGRHFYIRQLRDVKISATVEAMDAEGLKNYGKLCGRTLARAHARSGNPSMLAGYMGNSDVFDQAVTKFAVDYADQTERDHKTMALAVRDGRIEAQEVA
jgi:uncharacterized protein (DUF2252 family)